jgi:hypothetical protein
MDNVNKELRIQLHKGIIEELLNNNTALNGYVGKKIKILTQNYDLSLLLTIYEDYKSYLIKRIATITSSYGKVNYIFKVLEEQAKTKLI